MDIGSILIILALLVLVVLFVGRPLFEKQTSPASEQAEKQEHDLSAQLAERDRILNALRELDFDYALGKIPPEDYPAQRAQLVQEGVDVLRKLDELQDVAGQAELDARIEAEVARRRADLARQPSLAVPAGAAAASMVAVGADDDLEVILAQRRRQRQERAAGFCPQCGGPVQISDRFCPKCGATLK